MTAYFKRLAASGAAYQAASLLSAAFAALTLPLYTRHLTDAEYGYAETLLTFIILTSIILRLGIGEAFVRFWFDDEDEARRARLLRTTWTTVLLTTSAAALAGIAIAGPLSRLVLNHRDATLMSLGLLGLWAFTNLEVAYALLRVEERRRDYLLASGTNVLLTVALTITLVVGLDAGARGYLLGNYAASAAVLLALWWRNRHRLAVAPEEETGGLRAMLHFGAPTVPADAAVFALNVLDRAYLLRADSPGAAGRYAVAVKLSTAVIVAVRGFQAAWPPLAYSVADDVEAGRVYAAVTSAYVAVTGLVVAALTLLGRWLVRLLAAPDFYGAHAALPWVALGWALYGLFLVFVTIAGRARATRRMFPAALAGLVANAVALVVLVDAFGIAGAGIALCVAYLVMLVAVHHLTRDVFAVPFEWARLRAIVLALAVPAVLGELLLPTSGLAGLAERALLAAALVPLLVLTATSRAERRALRDGVARVRGRRRRDAAGTPVAEPPVP